MRPLTKVGIVAAGYAGAFAIASAVVALYVAGTAGPDRQTYGAMFAFGDGLLFVAVFGIAATPVTGALLFFLRPYRRIWTAISTAALAIAMVTFVGFVDHVAPRAFEGSSLHSWMALATLGILGAPLFAGLFFLSALFAPNRSARMSLLVAGTGEVCVFACWLLTIRR